MIKYLKYTTEAMYQLSRKNQKHDTLGGIAVRRRAHDSKVMGSIPALTTLEESIHRQGINTNRASLHSGV